MRITYGDLEKSVTLGEVYDSLNAGEIIELVRAGIEHWTDDEGLHVTRFEEDLRDGLNDWWDGIIGHLLD